MSWWISLTDADGGELRADSPHNIAGGTYAIGGTDELTLNVTYNYSAIFHRVLDGGIRSIDGKRASETLPLLREAAGNLTPSVCRDYWAPTEGNARAALEGLIALAEMAPHGIWRVN